MNEELSGFPSGKAVLFNGAGLPFKVTGDIVPVIKHGEILVKNLYTTLCGSDIHTYCGHRIEPASVVLGHEIVGDIVAIDSRHPAKDLRDNEVKAGDRITWSIFAVPANIPPPQPGMPQKSDQLYKYGHAPASGNDVFNGGLADFCVLRPNTAFVKISAEIPLKVAATISCAHATVSGALRVAGEIKNKKIIVFGAGLLGLSCTAMCREAGAATVTLVDINEERLRWGKRFGADDTRVFSVPAEPLPWPLADVVFDMTGYPEAMQMGLNSLAIGGCAVWIGAVFPAKAVQVDAQQLIRKLLQIRGLHNYNYDDFLNATSFIEDNYLKYPFENLVEKEYCLNEVEDAFKFASESKPVRVGIKIN